MKPESQQTQTTNNPGVIDLPKSRQSSSQVTTEKSKKKGIAAAKAQKSHEQKAWVTRVEKEIRNAQKEVGQPSRQGSQVKRTFPHEATLSDDAATEVKLIFDSILFTLHN